MTISHACVYHQKVGHPVPYSQKVWVMEYSESCDLKILSFSKCNTKWGPKSQTHIH